MSLVVPVNLLKQLTHLAEIKYTLETWGGGTGLPDSLLYSYSRLKEVSVNKTSKSWWQVLHCNRYKNIS